MADYINIKKLNPAELAGVVALYPWYGAARKELCVRMLRSGGDAWGTAPLGDAAFYMGARDIIADMMLAERKADCSDKDVKQILEGYLAQDEMDKQRSVRVAGGDFFTQAQYDGVREEGDNVFSRFAQKARQDKDFSEVELDDEFCTETLAQIYAEQGYYDQAKRIYSRLLLNFPEKSAYFASLIEKLDNN
ncbi:MAG: hypothetical protein IKR15_06680 [Bacteroidales bacterium]|nr:hypothetical protein [Bacteroidales bacterium]